MDVHVSEAALQDSKEASGRVSISWQDAAPEVCIYLAYRDPKFFWDPSRNINRSMNKNKAHRPNVGSIEVTKASLRGDWSKPIVKVPNKGKIDIDFSFILPQWPDRARKQFLFHQFYPQKLKKCPSKDDESIQLPDSKFTMDLAYPRRWALTTPGFHNGSTITQTGRFISFNLSIGHRVERFFVDKLPVTIVYRSDYMNRAKFYLQMFLRQTEAMLGDFPFERLLFLETEDLEKGAIPGIITLNRPRQAGMRMIQNDVLNWGLWQLAFYTCQQWFGASLHPKTLDDAWFFRGTADFIASLILQKDQKIYNIINSDDEQPWVTINHRQSADLIASILGILRPENALTDAQLKSKISYLEQHNFSYIRHLLALRFAFWLDGQAWIETLGDFYRSHQHQASSHESFYHWVKNERKKPELSSYLRLWWNRSDWPEFKIEDVDVKEVDGQVESVEVEVGQNLDFKLPYDVTLSFSSGATLTQRGRSNQSLVKFSPNRSRQANRNARAIYAQLDRNHETQYDYGKLTKVEINPGREIFDSNRFNNTNQWPDVVFFPGNADTIRDDAYTIVWLPFVSKLPGEQLSVMLSSQIFRYVNSGLSLLVNHIPSEDLTGYNAIFLSDFPQFSTFATFSAVQDFGLGLKGQRIFDLSLTRSNLIDSLPGFSLGLRFRQRGTVGDPDSNHGTAALFSSFQTQGMSACGIEVFTIHEEMLGITDRFSYRRSHGVGSWGCRSKLFSFGLRGFWGATRERGDPPSYVRFNPQTLDEGKLRIDSPNLTPVQRLWTASFDLEVPAHLPIPSVLFLLPRHSKWRFFYDYGESQGPEFSYHDYGIGFKLPFGGDVVGKRSLALASLSVLAVLEKSYEGQSSKKPGVLIDFLGKL